MSGDRSADANEIPIGDETFRDGPARNVLFGIFDFRFRTMTAIGAAKSLYLLAILGLAALCVGLVVIAFRRSTDEGWLWLVLAPVIFIGASVTLRIVIEFVLAILILMVRLEQTTIAVNRIVENTTDISAQTLGLPTLPTFGRGLKSFLVSDPARHRRREAQRAQLARQDAAAAEQEAAELAVQAAVDAAVARTLAQAAERAVRKSVEKQAALEKESLTPENPPPGSDRPE